jgi:nitrite reductase (NADH) large subunit
MHAGAERLHRVVVVGNGMVGQKFIEALTDLDTSRLLQITVVGEEPRPAYDRVHLSSYFSGSTATDLALAEDDFFATRNIHLILSRRVSSLHRESRTISLDDGQELAYDTLVLATGSYPFVPPIPGHDRDACHVYRTIEDLDAIQGSATRSRVGVVVGGGLLGLEAAKALMDLGLDTHVVEFAPRLMAIQVDDGGGAILRQKIESLGVKVHTQCNTVRIVDGESCRHRMEFANGESLDTDLILFSAGIRPRDELARNAGLEVGPRGGIVIDDNCLTSDESIYAIGECALWNGKLFGLVAPGYQMAGAVAARIAGQPSDGFTGADMSTKLKLLGVDVASIGDAQGQTPGARSCTFVDEIKGTYRKLVTDGKRLLGAVLIGEAEDYGTLLQLMLNDIPLPASPETMLLPAGTGAAPALGADALPEKAIICSCNNVTKGALCAAIDAGARDVGALKQTTKAATSCGGCSALVGQVLACELRKKGIEVKKDICEHFPYSRQEIHHLVKVGGIRSFDELIARHGRGLGCDICKPVAASVFASTWNDHVLAPGLAGLQDTNDHFLANLQKDGTYSVVPRMPGGEVTPDGLIACGQIAKKYGLYTKITGGQRVDMFGARVEQLPLIWKELIDAGFESGHAYGKAVRTVKSCVGSTWCRYGVQDSVGFAIAIEQRYRGIRAPHKLKFAVSGCTRECAEAQSKDVGIIATEKGWNLYVCGNGGMKPRHAELLASDLDDATLTRYVDRFLMFYIRTADRLQRTSVWRDNMEGGLDYLKQVIIEDSLGIAADLERDMQYLVDTYQCEWRATLEDPAKLERFRHFVNSDAGDDNIVFVQERGQIRPALPDEKSRRIAVTETA